MTTQPASAEKRYIRNLWVRMAEVYGNKWTSQNDDSESSVAETWRKGLAGITKAQLADGLQACLFSADPWPPTLPEFRARCLGIPTIAQVRLELRGRQHQTAPSPFARLVWSYISESEYRDANRHTEDRVVREAYDLAREHVMRGGELPSDTALQLTDAQRESWKIDFEAPPPEKRAAAVERARAEAGLDVDRAA